MVSVTTLAWQERHQHRLQSPHPELWNLLDQVKDPEVPVLSLWDLGVLCDVTQAEAGSITVVITPTYSGCPALETMRADIAAVLHAAGFQEVRIQVRLAPAWSTDGLSPAGREQLRAYGIAPPQGGGCALAFGLTPEAGIACPRCGSRRTARVSEFGSTACKALFRCEACAEPFDYFKHL